MNPSLIKKVVSAHKNRFGFLPQAAAYAPGRVEILGNHTDYNDGYVLSAAIDAGVCIALSPSKNNHCLLLALDAAEEAEFDVPVSKPLQKPHWANYLAGVTALLSKPDGKISGGFNAVFSGDVPAGAGLSSSAALEVATAYGFCALFNLTPAQMTLAKICQKAENEWTGARCGLLDQISSIFGVEHALVFTDFRLLNVETAPLDPDMCFLLANTGVKHNLVESAYNERRAACEQAARYFTSVLGTRVHALRDVTQEDFKKHSSGLGPVVARRAAHVIGENARVLEARQLLNERRMHEFGRLMFQSHQSSRFNFENSCPELDCIVDTVANLPQVFGARLSGGGFGGSVVMLIQPRETARVTEAVSSAYASRFGSACNLRAIKPSAGARILDAGLGRILVRSNGVRKKDL